jgi:hypothetical protein
MKSIKEKAEEYGYTNWQSDDYHEGASEGLDFDPIGHTQKSFEAGANYVLEEIEKIVKYDKDPRCIEFLKERIWRLKQ